MDLRAKLEIATATLHEDVYNVTKQGHVWEFKNALEGVENRKARGATVRARVKRNKVSNKCLADFFSSVKRKHNAKVITELKDMHGRIFTKREDIDTICHDFYALLYKHKPIREEAMREVFEGFTSTFTKAMNATLMEEMTEKELGAVVRDMAKGKAPGHDGIPVEFFQQMWSTLGGDFHHMILKCRGQ